jgi:hypothetical protein
MEERKSMASIHLLLGLYQKKSFLRLFLTTDLPWSPRPLITKLHYIRNSLRYVMFPTSSNRFRIKNTECLTLLSAEDAFFGFIDNEYWTRVWVLQEFLLSKNTSILLYGGHCLNESFVTASILDGLVSLRGTAVQAMEECMHGVTVGLPIFQRTTDEETGIETAIMNMTPEELQEMNTAMNMTPEELREWTHIVASSRRGAQAKPTKYLEKFLLLRSLRHTDEPQSLTSPIPILRCTYPLACRDPRDKIYGIYSLIHKLYGHLEVDYQALPHDVLWNFFANIIPKLGQWGLALYSLCSAIAWAYVSFLGPQLRRSTGMCTV